MVSNFGSYKNADDQGGQMNTDLTELTSELELCKQLLDSIEQNQKKWSERILRFKKDIAKNQEMKNEHRKI